MIVRIEMQPKKCVNRMNELKGMHDLVGHITLAIKIKMCYTICTAAYISGPTKDKQT